VELRECYGGGGRGGLGYILQTSYLATLDFRERRYICAILSLIAPFPVGLD